MTDTAALQELIQLRDDNVRRELGERITALREEFTTLSISMSDDQIAMIRAGITQMIDERLDSYTAGLQAMAAAAQEAAAESAESADEAEASADEASNESEGNDNETPAEEVLEEAEEAVEDAAEAVAEDVAPQREHVLARPILGSRR